MKLLPLSKKKKLINSFSKSKLSKKFEYLYQTGTGKTFTTFGSEFFWNNAINKTHLLNRNLNQSQSIHVKKT